MAIILMTGCVSSGDGGNVQSVLGLDSTATSSNPPPLQPLSNNYNTVPSSQFNNTAQVIYEAPNPDNNFASPVPDFTPAPPPPPRRSKTYLINGLASAIDAVGYGFTNLSKKIPNSELYNYASFIESSTIIRSRVARDIKREHLKDPNIEINLIGISFGANIVTIIAAELDRANIPVNYLVTMDGPAMRPVRDNVAKVDNFTCSGLTCFKTRSKLARGNTVTEYASFKKRTSHIALADNSEVHARILSQLERSKQVPLLSAAPQ